MTRSNTVLGLETFNNDILNTLILHIPHSSTYVPFYEGFVDHNLLENEIQLLTDHSTDKIFDVENVSKIITPFNRVFCDVERLDDENEPMFQFGRGFFYTKTDSGEKLRDNVSLLDGKFKINLNDLKKIVYDNYYLKHHNELDFLVNEKLNDFGNAIIIDCHSFTNEPFSTDIDKSENRPDICIGTDNFHTPKWLSNYIVKHFENNALSVKLNSPYSGTIVPLKYYKKNKNVFSIMIEINRKLYMTNNQVISENVEKLNTLIRDLFEF